MFHLTLGCNLGHHILHNSLVPGIKTVVGLTQQLSTLSSSTLMLSKLL